MNIIRQKMSSVLSAFRVSSSSSSSSSSTSSLETSEEKLMEATTRKSSPPPQQQCAKAQFSIAPELSAELSTMRRKQPSKKESKGRSEKQQNTTDNYRRSKPKSSKSVPSTTTTTSLPSSTSAVSVSSYDRRKKHGSKSSPATSNNKNKNKNKNKHESTIHFAASRHNDRDHNDDDTVSEYSSEEVDRTVPSPAPEVLVFKNKMTTIEQRSAIQRGHRVKTRFGREGWYGGMVTRVMNDGWNIRIKYDDGTTEVASFPDKDIVVDDEHNGTHVVDPDAFLPPSKRRSTPSERLARSTSRIRKRPEFFLHSDDELEKQNKQNLTKNWQHQQQNGSTRKNNGLTFFDNSSTNKRKRKRGSAPPVLSTKKDGTAKSKSTKSTKSTKLSPSPPVRRTQSVQQQTETPPKRKRGRPKKNPVEPAIQEDQPQEKQTVTTSGKTTTSKTTSEQQQQQDEEEEGELVKRKRGRPPKKSSTTAPSSKDNPIKKGIATTVATAEKTKYLSNGVDSKYEKSVKKGMGRPRKNLLVVQQQTEKNSSSSSTTDYMQHEQNDQPTSSTDNDEQQQQQSQSSLQKEEEELPLRRVSVEENVNHPHHEKVLKENLVKKLKNKENKVFGINHEETESENDTPLSSPTQTSLSKCKEQQQQPQSPESKVSAMAPSSIDHNNDTPMSILKNDYDCPSKNNNDVVGSDITAAPLLSQHQKENLESVGKQIKTAEQSSNDQKEDSKQQDSSIVVHVSRNDKGKKSNTTHKEKLSDDATENASEKEKGLLEAKGVNNEYSDVENESSNVNETSPNNEKAPIKDFSSTAAATAKHDNGNAETRKGSENEVANAQLSTKSSVSASKSSILGDNQTTNGMQSSETTTEKQKLHVDESSTNMRKPEDCVLKNMIKNGACTSASASASASATTTTTEANMNKVSHAEASTLSKQQSGDDDENDDPKEMSENSPQEPLNKSSRHEIGAIKNDDKALKTIDVGQRIRVRFSLDDDEDENGSSSQRRKKNGKTKWYYGNVARVLKRGSKIHINYDDGTSETTDYPDDDIQLVYEEGYYRSMDYATKITRKRKSSNTSVSSNDADIEEEGSDQGDNDEGEPHEELHIGQRVKVRFSTTSMRQGKSFLHRRWYKGSVAGVLEGGTKVVIDYDDGTSEVADYPDEDIMLDDGFVLPDTVLSEYRKFENKKKQNSSSSVGSGSTRKEISSDTTKAEPIEAGHRVKVRFIKSETRSGRPIDIRRWYKGTVVSVNPKRSSARIYVKYDDGTSEWSSYPDKDAVLLDEEKIDIAPSMLRKIPEDKDDYNLDADGTDYSSNESDIERVGSDDDSDVKKPSEARLNIWNKNFKLLLQYRKEHGDCNVPYRYGVNPALGFWVRRQRLMYSRSKLSKYYEKKLLEHGFEWDASYTRYLNRGKSKKGTSAASHADAKRTPKINNGKVSEISSSKKSITSNIIKSSVANMKESKKFSSTGQSSGHQYKKPKEESDQAGWDFYPRERRVNRGKAPVFYTDDNRPDREKIQKEPEKSVYDTNGRMKRSIRAPVFYTDDNRPDREKIMPMEVTSSKVSKKRRTNKSPSNTQRSVPSKPPIKKDIIKEKGKEKIAAVSDASFKKKACRGVAPNRYTDDNRQDKEKNVADTESSRKSFDKDGKDDTKESSDSSRTSDRPKQNESWKGMFERLAEYRSKHGHCKVPIRYKADPSLGRWVSRQRYLKSFSKMPTVHARKLQSIGFDGEPVIEDYSEKPVQKPTIILDLTAAPGSKEELIVKNSHGSRSKKPFVQSNKKTSSSRRNRKKTSGNVNKGSSVKKASLGDSNGKEESETGKRKDIWAVCDKCNKWRRLPGVADESELPSTWYCSMNRDKQRSRCDAPEEEYSDGEDDVIDHKMKAGGSSPAVHKAKEKPNAVEINGKADVAVNDIPQHALMTKNTANEAVSDKDSYEDIVDDDDDEKVPSEKETELISNFLFFVRKSGSPSQSNAEAKKTDRESRKSGSPSQSQAKTGNIRNEAPQNETGHQNCYLRRSSQLQAPQNETGHQNCYLRRSSQLQGEVTKGPKQILEVTPSQQPCTDFSEIKNVPVQEYPRIVSQDKQCEPKQGPVYGKEPVSVGDRVRAALEVKQQKFKVMENSRVFRELAR